MTTMVSKLLKETICCVLMYLCCSYTLAQCIISQNPSKPYSPHCFFTNREENIIDTVFLPVQQRCVLLIDVRRFIDDVKRNNNNDTLPMVHLYESSLQLQAVDRDLIKDFCWSPIRYKRILPFLIRIFDVDSIEQISYYRLKEQLVDLIYLHKDTLFDFDFWETEKGSDLGKTIADYMPFIEMFLWQKIAKEVTLVDKDKKLISESFIIFVSP